MEHRITCMSLSIYVMSVLWALYPLAPLCRIEADLHRNCPLSKKKATFPRTCFLTFPWQQQTLHTRGARGLQLKQGLSLRDTAAEDGLRLPLHPLLLSFFFFLGLFSLYPHLPPFSFANFFMALSQTDTPSVVLSVCACVWIETQTPPFRITREGVLKPSSCPTKTQLFPGPVGSSGTHGPLPHAHITPTV